ncbi:MAG: SLOG family protein [Monoglobales bacterium]
MKTVCFTGRRPQKLPWGYNENDPRCIKLKNELKKKIEEAVSEGALHFISGMALGVDMWAAEIVLSLKKTDSRITLEAAVPYRKQSASWSFDNKSRHSKILKDCDKVTYVSENYSAYCMMKRNKYMVDSSDLVIAATDDFSGGSGKTALYARSKGVPVWFINI